jgi:hypothetical protein
MLILRGVWVFLVVRSVQRSDDFWEGSGTPRDGRRGKRKHDGVRIFSRISTMAPGIQLILLVIFKKEHGLFQAVNVRILGQK